MKFDIPITALAAGLVLIAGAARAEDGVESFKDWTVVCDNQRACTVAGFGSETEDLPAVLRLSRSGAAGAPARIEIDQADGDVKLDGKAPALAVDGKMVLTARSKPLSDGG